MILKFRVWIEKQKYMAVQGTSDIETLASFMHHYSDEKYLMQSTGILDKHGKEIFEDNYLIDIEFEEDGTDISSLFLVIYDKKQGAWCIDNSYKKDHSSLVPIVSYFGLENLELWGNIYENNIDN